MTLIIANATPYGELVQYKLIQKKRTQGWLIEELRQRTGMYVDRSNLNKILTGVYRSEKIIAAINEILDIKG